MLLSAHIQCGLKMILNLFDNGKLPLNGGVYYKIWFFVNVN